LTATNGYVCNRIFVLAHSRAVVAILESMMSIDPTSLQSHLIFFVYVCFCLFLFALSFTSNSVATGARDCNFTSFADDKTVIAMLT